MILVSAFCKTSRSIGEAGSYHSRPLPEHLCERYPTLPEDRRTYYRECMRVRVEAERSSRPLKRCEPCGDGFQVRQGKHLYCSDACVREARLQRRRDREYRPQPFDCAHCQEPVPYKSGRRRYCSNECQLAAQRDRSRWRVKGLEEDPGSRGICALCRAVGRRLDIDHDHRCCPGERACGECFRGMLCRSCNVGLGLFQDDPALLRKAARYIEEAQQLKLAIA